MVRGTLTLVNRETDEIYIETRTASPPASKSAPLPPGWEADGQGDSDRAGGGHPRISKSPLSLTAGPQRTERKHLVHRVPIKLNETIGALSVDRLFADSVRWANLRRHDHRVDRAGGQDASPPSKRSNPPRREPPLAGRTEGSVPPANIIGSRGTADHDHRAGREERDDGLIRGERRRQELVASDHYNSLRASKPFIR